MNTSTSKISNRVMELCEPIIATYCYDGEHVANAKEFTENIIKDTIREFIVSQHKHTFGEPPTKANLSMYVSGFILFNLHKNTKHILIEYYLYSETTVLFSFGINFSFILFLIFF